MLSTFSFHTHVNIHLPCMEHNVTKYVGTPTIADRTSF